MKTFALVTVIAVFCEAAFAYPGYGKMDENREKISFIEDQLNTLHIMSKDLCLSGLKSGSVPDSALTASSTHPGCPIVNARLDSGAGWCTLVAGVNDVWIQVDLGRMQPITGIVTQGRNNAPQYVTKYKVEVGPDVYNLKPVTEDENIVIFKGNSDLDTRVWNEFPGHLHGQIVRVYPLAYEGWSSMRFDVTFC